MVVSTVILLIPTATAADLTLSQEARPTDSWTYYAQDFNDGGLAAKTDVELAQALGWTEPNDKQTMMVENGKLRYVSQYNSGSAYQTKWLSQGDDRMLSNVTVIEYDIRFQRREQDESNDIVVSDSKTIAADGQGAKGIEAMVQLGSSNSGKIMAARFDLQGTVTPKVITGTAENATANGVTMQSYALDVMGAIPSDGTVTVEKGSNTTATCYEKDYHVRIVLDPVTGSYYFLVNNVLILKTADEIDFAGGIRRNIAHITDSMTFIVKNGCDILLDNVEVYGYTEVPKLVVSEVSTNGFGVNADGSATTVLAEQNGYQWIELYNAGVADVNVYDYALHVNNMPSAADSVFGQNADVTGFAGRGSMLGYLRAGLQQFAWDDGQGGQLTSSFTNPAYAEGVLRPGESAVVILPATLHAAGKTLDPSAIRAELVQKGMGEATKLLVCDNYADYPFMLAREGVMTVGLMELADPTKAGTEEAAGKYVGVNDSALFLLESYTILSAYDQSYSEERPMVYEGFFIGANSVLPAASALSLAGKSVEISYWEESVAASSKLGVMKFNADQYRLNGTGFEGTVSPGMQTPTIGPNLVLVVSSNKKGVPDDIVSVKAGSRWAPDEALIGDAEQYIYHGISVDGATDLVQFVDFSFATRSATVELIYERVAPEFIGLQKTQEVGATTYSVRLLAGVNRRDLETVGIKYSYTYKNEHGKLITKEEVSKDCQFVYTAIHVAGTEYSASELGDFELLYAVYITNIPTAATELDITATPYVWADQLDTASLDEVPYLIEDVDALPAYTPPAP